MNTSHRKISVASIGLRVITAAAFLLSLTFIDNKNIPPVHAADDEGLFRTRFQDASLTVNFDILAKRNNNPQTPTNRVKTGEIAAIRDGQFYYRAPEYYTGGWPRTSWLDGSGLPDNWSLIGNSRAKGATSIPLVETSGNHKGELIREETPSDHYVEGLTLTRRYTLDYTAESMPTWPYFKLVPHLGGAIEIRLYGDKKKTEGDPDAEGKIAMSGTITLQNAVFTGGANNPEKKQRVDDRKGEAKSRLGRCLKDWTTLYDENPSIASFSLTACGQEDSHILYYRLNESATPVITTTPDPIPNIITPEPPTDTGTPMPQPVAAPTLNFTANPSTVPYNGISNLAWNTTNAVGCVAQDAWSGPIAVNGSTPTGPLTQATRYQITCNNSAGVTVTRAITIQVEGAPTLTISATPSTVPYNGASVITWNSANVVSCWSSGSTLGNGWIALNGQHNTGNLAATTTYSIECLNAAGVSTGIRSVTVGVEGAPTLVMTATPPSVDYGGSSLISWTTTNVSSCWWHGYLGWIPTNGSQGINNLTQTATYSIECWNAAGYSTGIQSTTVQVSAPPTLTVTANPTNVDYNGNSVITWTSANVSSCWSSGTPLGNGWIGTNGTHNANNLTQTVTYAIECWNRAGFSTGIQSVTVNVEARPTLSFRANPPEIRYNQSSILTWSTSNVDRCVATDGWTGNKATGGAEGTGNITGTRTYTLECFNGVNYSTGPVTLTVTVIPPQCQDGADNDTDSLTDAADPGCHQDDDINKPYVATDDSELHIPPFDGGNFTEQD